MEIDTNLSCRFFLLIALLSVVAISFADSDSDLIGELVSLRSTADSGVIRLDDDGVSRFITSVAAPRPYSFLIFFDVVDLYSKSEDLTEPSYSSAKSEASFHRFAVESLPQNAWSTLGWRIYRTNPVKWNTEIKLNWRNPWQSSSSVEPNSPLAQSIRPPLLSKTQISLIAALIVISTPILIKKVLKGDMLLHDRRVWLSAVFVYFFSVAGTMHNIIRTVAIKLEDWI